MDGDDPGGRWDDPDDEWVDDGDHIRGWIPPDDRLWRHPSETATAFGTRGVPARGVSLAGQRGRSGTWIVGGTGVCLVLALVAVGLIVVTSAGNDGGNTASPDLASLTRAPTTEPGTGRLEDKSQIAGAVAAVRPSTVALLVDKPSGTTVSTGLVAESGGIIVTAAASLAGAGTITAVEPNGSHQVVEVVGVDQASSLAVVRIGDDLPAASFDEDDPARGSVALTLAMEPGRRARDAPAVHVYAGTVISSGQPIGTNGLGADFAPTTVSTPLTEGDLGSPLLDSSGGVTGLLEQVDGSGSASTSIFLPAETVLGVARQLVTSGTVEHGWFGIEGDDASTSTTASTLTATTTSPPPNAKGALVTAVEDSSPAAGCGLEPGDLVTALDGHQVHSIAELRARLYADPPGTTLEVTYERGGAVESATVVLADGSADAQEAGSPP